MRLGNADLVSMLLKLGCHPNPIDYHGMTPELLAIEENHTHITNILSQHLDALEDENGGEEKNEKFLKATETTLESRPNPWRLLLPRGPNIGKTMTSDVSIYAIEDSICPPTLIKLF